jgi:hypothetical protein
MDISNNLQTGTFLDSKLFDPMFLFEEGSGILYDITYFIFISRTFKVLLAVLAIFFLTIIAYSSIRMFEIRRKERTHLQHEITEYAHHLTEQERKKKEGEGASKNEKWNNVLMHLLSSNQGDWKLAVIEADLMLEVLLDQLGFSGQGVGERLKSADREKFPSLTKAWEVHTVRNRIAHEGLDFELSLHEARRVIALYESIFREFGFI